MSSDQMVDTVADYVAIFSLFFGRCAAARAAPLRHGADDLPHVLHLQARQLNTQFELIGIRNDRLATRIALHLALGGGFAQTANP